MVDVDMFQTRGHFLKGLGDAWGLRYMIPSGSHLNNRAKYIYLEDRKIGWDEC